jgi:hypothetical protein
MPRYLVVRTFTVGADDMPEVGRRSRKLIEEQYRQITWEHSHVTVDDDAVVRTFCVYAAPDEDVVREHAVSLGNHTVDSVLEIAGDVTPADFPG